MEPRKEIIKVVMADDHTIFRDGFKLIIGSDPGVQLLDQASNGIQLIALVEKYQPDVVVTDIKMPVMDGIAATQKIMQEWPDLKVLALTMYDEDDWILKMLEAGVAGYLLKNADKDEVLEAIHTVYGGDPYYCRTTNSKLAKLIAHNRYHTYKRAHAPEFTDKELEIIQLICQEYTNREIGDKLFLSVRTVEGYRLKILEKMNVKNSAGLVIYALQHGLFTLK